MKPRDTTPSATPETRDGPPMQRSNPFPIFAALAVEWIAFASAPATVASLGRWRRVERSLVDVSDLDDLLQRLRDSADLDARDARWRALLRLAGADADARRVLLQAVVPGLVSVARRYARPWDRDDVASAVVVAALARIAAYPHHRPASPVANIVRDAQHAVHRLRLTEARDRRALAAHHTRPLAERPAADELVELVCDAVDGGQLSSHAARLIVEYRVFGMSSRKVGDRHGRRAATVRKARSRAERALSRSPAAAA
jgi:DNA-directed RNA polymerase specialized sigma24 family protein